MANPICAVLLAGGLARRMGGGDKGLRRLAGRTILEHVILRLKPQVSAMVLNANGDLARFSDLGLPVVADSVQGFAGPLAGILAGLDWAAIHQPQCTYVLSAPTDCPFLPHDLAERLWAAREKENTELAGVISSGQTHPVIGLWPVSLREDLRRALVQENMRKIDRWTARYRLALVEWPVDPIDPFFNANTPEDIETAERFSAGGSL